MRNTNFPLLFLDFPGFRGLGEGFQGFRPQIRVPRQKLYIFHPRIPPKTVGARTLITGGGY